MSFLQRLQEYDKDAIPDSIMDKTNKEFVKLPEFDPAVVAKASSAAEGLCKWVRAMSAYNAIAKVYFNLIHNLSFLDDIISNSLFL